MIFKPSFFCILNRSHIIKSLYGISKYIYICDIDHWFILFCSEWYPGRIRLWYMELRFKQHELFSRTYSLSRKWNHSSQRNPTHQSRGAGGCRYYFAHINMKACLQNVLQKLRTSEGWRCMMWVTNMRSETYLERVCELRCQHMYIQNCELDLSVFFV